MSEDKNRDADSQRHWRVEEDAYDDLLNSYFGSADNKKSTSSSVEKTNRTTDIKPSKPTTVKKSSAAPQAEKPAGSKKNEFKLEIKDLESEFNTKAEKPVAKRQQPVGVPRAQLYKKAEPTEKKRVHSRQTEKAEPKPVRKKSAEENVSKNNLSDTIDFIPAFSYDRIKEKNKTIEPEYHTAQPVHNKAGEAVIIKKNKIPPKKKIVQFILNNKKAWVIVLICIVCSIFISTYAISCMNDILAIRRNSENVVTINIPSETNTKGVIDLLKENKLIKHKYFCLVFAKAMDFRDDNYLTGIYYLTESMGLENMLSTFKESPVTGETVSLAFPEGFSVDQIAEKLEKYGVCTKTAFYTTMRDVDFSSEYTFIADEDNKDLRYHSLEGYLFPDTYEFYVGENAASVIRRFLDNFQSKWSDEYAAQAQKLGMSVDDIVTLASIIEKEAYGADQMPQVSSVLHNRLNKSGLYPTLQCDSTTAYINEYISKNVTDATALGKYTKNYSTYNCEGLPVGAICNPGNDAINAALYPASTNYYFFLHDNNKKLYLAANDAEHRANGIAALKANTAKDSQ